jgi:autotransporter-associated beta strand protein
MRQLTGRFAAVLLCVAVFSAFAANAQTYWLANPTNNNYNTQANWSADLPGGVTPGTFNTSAITSIDFSGTTTFVPGLSFNPGASAYTFSLNANAVVLTAAGIRDSSSNAPTFILTNSSELIFDIGSLGTAKTVVDATSSLTFGLSLTIEQTRASAGTADINSAGTITFLSSGTAANAQITNNSSGVVEFLEMSTAGAATIANNGGQVLFQDSSNAGNAVIINSGTVAFFSGASGASARYVGQGGTLDISQIGGSGTTLGSIEGSGTIALGSWNLSVGANGASTTFSGTIADGGAGGGTGGSLTKTGAGILTLTGANTYTGGTTITGGLINFAAANNFGIGAITLNGGGLHWATGNPADISSRLAPLGAAGGTFDTNGNTVIFATALSGPGGLTKNGLGTLTLSGSNSYLGGTTINAGVLMLAPGASLGGGALTINGGSFNSGGNSVTLTSLSGSGGLALSGGSLTINLAGNATYSGAISGSGGLVKQGAGTLTLTGSNSYSGGGTVSAGTLAGTTSGLQGNILNNAAVAFSQATNGVYAGTMSGTGSVGIQGGGIVNFTGANTYTGPTAVNGGTLAVNGSITSNVTVNAGGALGGNGTVFGTVAMLGTLAPGNSIGLLTVNGAFTQAAGSTYAVEVNGAGQGDRLVVNGTAAINGGAVEVIAAQGTYPISTTYAILTASGGLSGTYSSVNSNLAFLTPTLSYDANDVYLTLALLPPGSNPTSATVGFLRGATTGNEQAVATALNLSVAAGISGDFATVIGALANLSTTQGSWALNQISGQPIANFGTGNVASNALFMNALGQQMAVARGAQGGQRQALAQACEIEACDGTSPFSVWGSLLGGVGNVQGNGNSSTFTYNLGGAASGIDYRIDPRFLVGLGAGYTAGTQWVDSFQGKAWSNGVSVVAYGSFTDSNVYVDALAGYAYSNNQLQQYLVIPGLQPRQANGSTGANAFLGQVETGYRIGVYAPAAATVTPFARFQATSINQAGFSEWGANSLNLNVAQQTTSSLRTTLGADLAGTIGPLLLGLRLGWLHEYADTSRPMTAAFAGAPAQSFTVYGASPQRDAAVIGFSASANVADNMSIYLRYDGEIAAGADNHSLNFGLRLNW